jgi:hypothetical protein
VRSGRPPLAGYQRIVGELNGLGLSVSVTTVQKILRAAGLGPAGARSGLSWRTFLRQQTQSMLAVDLMLSNDLSTVWSPFAALRRLAYAPSVLPWLCRPSRLTREP